MNNKSDQIKWLRKLGLVPNTLKDMLLKWPNHGWSMASVSDNPNIDIEFIVQHPEYKWRWDWVSVNPSVTFQDILAHLEYPWEWNWVSHNQFLTMKDVLSHPELPWHWPSLSSNVYFITFQDVMAHPKCPWDYAKVSVKPNIDLTYVIAHPEYAWDWKILTENPGISLDTIFSNYNLPWHKNRLIYREDIKLKHVIGHPEIVWSFDHVSRSSEITVEDVVNNPDLPWNWYNLCQHNFFTTQHYIDKVFPGIQWKWDWNAYILNPLFKFEDLAIIPDINRYTSRLSFCPVVTIEYMKQYPNLHWDKELIALNPNITIEYIIECKIKLRKENRTPLMHFEYLRSNMFELNTVVAEKCLSKYRPKSSEFKAELKARVNHFKYKPNGLGYEKTVKSWNRDAKSDEKE